MKRTAQIATSALLLAAYVSAQWFDYREPNVPRGKDGKVNLSAPAPRTGGKPDLSGVWMHEPTPLDELRRLFGAALENLPPGMSADLQTKYGANLLIDFEPSARDAMMRPAGVAARQRIAAQINAQSPDPCGYYARVRWEMFGWPQMGLLSEPIKIVQAPKATVILYEAGNLHRQIFADGRKFPARFELPAHLGYSIGRWEGDTFVVETRGFKETYLDSARHPRGESTRITERFRRRDFGHLDMEITVDDPEFYAQPFTVRIPHTLLPDSDVLEMFCENEKDADHIFQVKAPSKVNVPLDVLAKYAGTYEGRVPGGDPRTFQFRLEGSTLLLEEAGPLTPLSVSVFMAAGQLLIRFEEQAGVLVAFIGQDELKLTRK